MRSHPYVVSLYFTPTKNDMGKDSKKSLVGNRFAVINILLPLLPLIKIALNLRWKSL